MINYLSMHQKMLMRKISFIFYSILITVTSVSCEHMKKHMHGSTKDTTTTTAKNTMPAPPVDSGDAAIVGNDRDEHGCIGSAGYTWSVVTNDCIRLFESATRLNPEGDMKENSSISAFVLFSKDEKQAELFLPGVKSSTLLAEKMENGNKVWAGSSYKLSFQNGGYTLTRDGKQIYGGIK
jgi:hypothetical protein